MWGGVRGKQRGESGALWQLALLFVSLVAFLCAWRGRRTGGKLTLVAQASLVSRYFIPVSLSFCCFSEGEVHSALQWEYASR